MRGLGALREEGESRVEAEPAGQPRQVTITDQVVVSDTPVGGECEREMMSGFLFFLLNFCIHLFFHFFFFFFLGGGGGEVGN